MADRKRVILSVSPSFIVALAVTAVVLLLGYWSIDQADAQAGIAVTLLLYSALPVILVAWAAAWALGELYAVIRSRTRPATWRRRLALAVLVLIACFSLTAPIVVQVVRHGIRVSKASSRDRTPKEFDDLFRGAVARRDWRVLHQLAANTACPQGTLTDLASLAGEESASVRYRVAANPSTPPAVLHDLADDPHWVVRAYAARNPSTPWSDVLQLQKDPHERVRAIAAEHVRQRRPSREAGNGAPPPDR